MSADLTLDRIAALERECENDIAYPYYVTRRSEQRSLLALAREALERREGWRAPAPDWLDKFDGDKPAYSTRELLELIAMLLNAQIREQRINSIEELHGVLRHINCQLRQPPGSPPQPDKSEALDPANEVSRLIQEALRLAPKAGLYLGVTVTEAPQRPETNDGK